MLPSRWSHLARHGLLGTTLLGLAAQPAAAESCDYIAGSTIGFVFGVDLSPRARVFGGIEGRRCVANNTEVMARFEIGGGSPRLIVGGRVRPFEKIGDNGDAESLGVEAGGVIDMEARLGLHIAATYGNHSAYLAAQGLILVSGAAQPPRISVLAGLAPWTAFGSTVVEGRPLIHDGRLVRPALQFVPSVRSAEDRDVRDHFTSSAQFEMSSVWTFLRLAEELAAVGAPAALIAAALDAADDEVRHAELCAAAAGGVELSPLPLGAALPRFTARSAHALAILAAEAWCEGCLNEGAAAEEARLAAAETTGETRSMLVSIARDEAEHAALSWAVLAWLFETAPAITKAAIAQIPATAGERDAPAIDAALVRRGVPSPQITAAARAHAATTARTHLRALVA
jgi:hypothetical protein